jgi:2-polyprenyl-6-methoxyphenol hydroxylase-like FAD-dependent oxidoreductase
VADRAEFVYGDCITSIEQSAADVRATFVRTRPQQFDLLIDADGMHSTVRHLAFGNGSLKKYLGYYAASFSVRDYAHRDENAYICYSIPSKQIAGLSVFLFVWAADAKLRICVARSRNQDRPTPGIRGRFRQTTRRRRPRKPSHSGRRARHDHGSPAAN